MPPPRLLLSQLGEQRLGAELGVGEPQPTDGLKEAVVGHGKGGRPPAPRTTERFKFGEDR